jgi:hypothetical protein
VSGPPSLEDALGSLELERRVLLRSLGLAVGLACAPIGCSGVPASLRPPPDARLRALGPRTYAVFTAAALRIVGPAGAPLIADRRVDVGLLADQWLARTPAVAGPIDQALGLLEFGVWPLLGKLRPFTALDGAAQDAVLTECMRSRLETKRAVFRGVRALVLLAFYGSPATRPLTGFPGPFGAGAVTIADAMAE